MKPKSTCQSALLFILSFLFLQSLFAQNGRLIDMDASYYATKHASIQQTQILQNAPNSNKQGVASGKTPAATSNSNNAPNIGVSQNCIIPTDNTWIAIPGNDDGSYGPVTLPFNFNLYGTTYTQVYINTNGNITFSNPYPGYSANGFPFSLPMIAPFWADVETDICDAVVYFKVNPTNLIVAWPGVHYAEQYFDPNTGNPACSNTLVNNFEVVISNGTDPLIGTGNNVAFYYGDMQWTTGDYSGGVNGFGGTPATVGINKGDGVNYIQVGRFNMANSDYDGGGGNYDGVYYLNNQCFTFNVSNDGNQPPSFSGLPTGNSITVNCGETVNLTIQALPPEVNQNVSTVVNTNGLCNTTFSTTNGVVSTTNLSITGSNCNAGTHVITFTATDDGSPTRTTVSTLTVNVVSGGGNQVPVITTNGNQNVNNDPGVCGANVSVTASAAGNCSQATTTGVRSDGLALSAIYPIGVTTITWNAVDGSGNAAVPVTQTVTVTDTQVPVITTNGNQSVNNDPGVCGAIVTISATATDNCTVTTPTGVRSDGLALNAVYPVGTTTITWNVTDANGNPAVPVTQTVTVTDIQKPVITTNGNQNVNTDPGVCGATVTVSASATDNCSVVTPTGTRSDGLTLNAVYPIGTTTITWNVTDANGNAAAPVTQTVIVTDSQKPVINTNGNQSVNNDPGVCGASVNVSATATDNCMVATPTGVRSDGLALNAVYPIGTTTITWNVTDANGNVAVPVTQTVTVTDTQKPVITTNGNQNVNNSVGVCGASVTVSATATDNCTVAAPTGARSDGLALNAVFPIGTTTITWNVADANGNAAVPVTQTVIVNDTQKPTITCTANKSVNANNGSTSYLQSGTSWDVIASDNCSITSISYTLSGATTSATGAYSTLNNVLFNQGITNVNAVVTDASGNTSTCAFTVTVSAVSTLAATCTNSNPHIYFGLSGYDISTYTVTPTGGKAPYKISVTMNRNLLCNQVNCSGDETWKGGTGTSSSSNISCPVSGSASGLPVSLANSISAGGSYSLTLSLMANATITATVTDANGISTSCSTNIVAEDVRCFAGNSGNAKVSMCHFTGSSKNPYSQICIAPAAVSAHLAQGDQLGTCGAVSASNMTTPVISATAAPTKLEVKVAPNPTSNYFNFTIGSASNDLVHLRVTDNVGRIIEIRTVAANSNLQLGEKYHPGSYFIEFIQGTERVVLKLIKEGN